LNTTKKTALITGVTGQDGSYMAESLIANGYQIVAIVRNASNVIKINQSTKFKQDIVTIQWNFLDNHTIRETLLKYRPIEIYNFAAFSSGSGMFDSPVEIADVNGLAVTRILDAIRLVDINIRFCQASSSEMFGNALESPQSEHTVFRPRTPYGAAKLYAHSMIDIYRKRYGMFACSAILFNHESPRRGLNFVSRKVARAAAAIKFGDETDLVLSTLDARRDWGFAGDYVRAMQLMLQHSEPDDYVVATGVTHSVQELCDIAFSHVGLDYRDFVKINPDYSRATETLQLVGDASKAHEILGWEPSLEFANLIRMMVDSEIRSFK
jgi:GDPmannose 4,6-dehydratase